MYRLMIYVLLSSKPLCLWGFILSSVNSIHSEKSEVLNKLIYAYLVNLDLS